MLSFSSFYLPFFLGSFDLWDQSNRAKSVQDTNQAIASWSKQVAEQDDPHDDGPHEEKKTGVKKQLTQAARQFLIKMIRSQARYESLTQSLGPRGKTIKAFEGYVSQSVLPQKF